MAADDAMGDELAQKGRHVFQPVGFEEYFPVVRGVLHQPPAAAVFGDEHVGGKVDPQPRRMSRHEGDVDEALRLWHGLHVGQDLLFQGEQAQHGGVTHRQHGVVMLRLEAAGGVQLGADLFPYVLLVADGFRAPDQEETWCGCSALGLQIRIPRPVGVRNAGMMPVSRHRFGRTIPHGIRRGETKRRNHPVMKDGWPPLPAVILMTAVGFPVPDAKDTIAGNPAFCTENSGRAAVRQSWPPPWLWIARIMPALLRGISSPFPARPPSRKAQTSAGSFCPASAFRSPAASAPAFSITVFAHHLRASSGRLRPDSPSGAGGHPVRRISSSRETVRRNVLRSGPSG